VLVGFKRTAGGLGGSFCALSALFGSGSFYHLKDSFLPNFHANDEEIMAIA